MDIISQWANICESLDEEKRINKALAVGCKTKDEINEAEDDFDNMSDEKVVKTIKDRTSGDPSYDDILKIAQKNKTPEEDIISQEDYEKYSDEDKRRIHTAVVMMDKTETPKVEEYSDLLVKDPKEFLRRSDELIKDLERRSNSDSSSGPMKYTYVYSAEVVYRPSNRIEKTPNGDLADDMERKYGGDDEETTSAKIFYSKIIPGEYEINKNETKEFVNLDDAKSYVAQRVREVCEKYHVEMDDFDTISIKHEQRLTGKKSTMVSGLPAEILNEDPDAIGFCCSMTRDKNGKTSKKVADGKLGPTEETILFEYFIYQSSKGKIMGTNSIKDLTKKISEEALS